MKVVVAHNRYSSAVPSGENMVVDAEIEMLREAGVEVIPFIKSSDSLDSVGAKLKASTGPVWAPATRELARILDAEKPDVLHLHNVYPLISPWAIRTAKARGVAVVQTMHNYRHQCVAGTHLREGKICEDCTPRGLGLAAVKYGCYRGSRVQSAAMVTGRRVHRSTWQMVDRYFALTPFMARWLAAQSIDRARITVRANSCPDPGEWASPTRQRALFVGRLDGPKGVMELAEAWQASAAAALGWTLAIAGSGPLSDALASLAGGDPSLELLGSLPHVAVAAEYRESAVVVIPSSCLEGYPLVLAEAFAHGRMVIVADTPNLRTIVPGSVGLRVPRQKEAWVAALSQLDLAEAAASGREAREHYVRDVSPDAVLDSLLAGYQLAREARADS